MKATVKVVRRQGDGSESCLKDVQYLQCSVVFLPGVTDCVAVSSLPYPRLVYS